MFYNIRNTTNFKKYFIALRKLSSIFASVIVVVLPHKLIKHPIWSLYIEIRK